jgi:CHAT domain-containing protein
MGNIPGAIDLQARANLLTERNIEFNLTTGSQNQRLLYLQLTDAEFNQTISLDVDKNGGARAREIAIAAVLQRKGRVLDALAATADLLRQRPNSDDTQLIRQLKDTNAQLAAISLNVPVGLKPEVYREQIADLQKEKERLEIELSRRTSASLKSSKTASTESIRALIPADSALIEFVAYRPIQKNTAVGADALYVAYVIRNAGEPAMVPIGKAVEIDPLVSEFRNSLRDIRRRDSQKLAKGIYAKLILPIRQALGDAKQLIVSPEGELNLMPFEALIDEKNKFLIEGHAISYVTSGRDLVRMQQKRESRSAPIIFADPDFGAVSDDRVASTGAAPSQRRRSVTVTRELSGTYFAPLRGTATEADAIRKLFREAALRTSRDASEAAIKSVNAPQILHIATHGFFLTDTGLSGAVGNPDRQPSHPSNALLRSGLALFGANARNGSAEDGLLTALEASSLNLWGTKLVVLSACDTGIGEVRAGEGVFGLRRAFALAGAESLVMSLWPVSDHVTRELMVAYYKNLKEGTGRGESLRRAKLELLRRPGRSHPFYWASFIQSGEWANLSGTR